jgi:hypothetical protein
MALRRLLSLMAGGTDPSFFLSARFLAAAVEEGGELQARADPEGADAFRAADLVGGERDEVGVGCVEGELGEGLGCVCVEEGAVGVGFGCHVGDGPDGADFVVDPHGRDEGDVACGQRGGIGGAVWQAVWLDRNDGGGGAATFQVAGGFEDAAVFCGEAEEAAGAGFQRALQGEVVGLGRAGSEDEALGVAGERGGEPDAGGFEGGFALIRAVGDAFVPAYLPIVQRRRETAYGETQRDFQAYRRGRYVEFNLVWDRGTHFGLHGDGRTESILMSMPPIVKWRYDWKPEAGTPEARLYTDFLRPRDWLAGG